MTHGSGRVHPRGYGRRLGRSEPLSLPILFARTARPTLGAVPVLALTSALGLALEAGSDALSRTGHSGAGVTYWVGLLVVYLPIVSRLILAEPARGERVGLLVLLGATSYLVKVLHEPYAFTSTDELVHQYNVIRVLGTHALFAPNPILPVTRSYPGLAAFTAALASLTGLSTFTAGLVVIGLARLLMVLALFLLYEAITESSRVSALAVAIYATSPHFLFFLAGYDYESLALPLALAAVLLIARSGSGLQPRSPRFVVLTLLSLLAVVATHHMTSYAVAAFLLLVCLIPVPPRVARDRGPWGYAVAAVVMSLAWLVLVASQTVGYLSPVIGHALSSTVRVALAQSPTRGLFGGPGATSSPLWEHVVAIASVGVAAAAVWFGGRFLWHHFRDDPRALVLGGAGALYLVSLPLRFVSAAWETASRASEFLFLGTALLASFAVVEAVRRGQHARTVHAIALACVGILLVGDVISVEPYGKRLAQPYRVAVGDGRALDPPIVDAARWMRRTYGAGARVVAEQMDARILAVDGGARVFTGSNPSYSSVLQSPSLASWQLDLLKRHHIRYAVIDSLRASDDSQVDIAFARGGAGSMDRFPQRALTKFERLGARRIYDSGDIVVDDLRGLTRG